MRGVEQEGSRSGFVAVTLARGVLQNAEVPHVSRPETHVLGLNCFRCREEGRGEGHLWSLGRRGRVAPPLEGRDRSEDE